MEDIRGNGYEVYIISVLWIDDQVDGGGVRVGIGQSVEVVMVVEDKRDHRVVVQQGVWSSVVEDKRDQWNMERQKRQSENDWQDSRQVIVVMEEEDSDGSCRLDTEIQRCMVINVIVENRDIDQNIEME